MLKRLREVQTHLPDGQGAVPRRSSSDLVAQDAPLRVRRLTTSDELDAVADAWNDCWSRHHGRTIEQHVAFLRRDHPDTEGRSRVQAIVVERDGELVGIAPLVAVDHHVRWRIRLARRHIDVLKFPARAALFSGDAFVVSDPAARALLLEGLVSLLHDFDLVRFRYARMSADPCKSLFGTRPRGYWRWATERDAPVLTVQLSSSYDSYLRETLSKKRRDNVKRETRLLEQRDGGPLRLRVFTKPDEVSDFLDFADDVFAQSWHAAQGANRIRQRDTEERMQWLAHRSWLRCYVLFKGDRPIAFVQGLQCDGVFRALRTAYVNDLAENSPGKAMWFKVINDLHESHEFHELNFGYGDWQYKRVMATGGYVVRSFEIVRPSLRNGLIFSGPVAYARARTTVIGALERSRAYDRLAMWARKNLAR